MIYDENLKTITEKFISLLMNDKYKINKVNLIDNNIHYNLDCRDKNGNIYNIEGFITINNDPQIEAYNMTPTRTQFIFNLTPVKNIYNNIEQLKEEHKKNINRLFEIALFSVINNNEI